ncbi:MAG: hypothetical protein JSS36_04480 [Proteobacteria bacterium]|nr:hypothetical protein [Pseudomonadota bacterium]
MSEPALHHSVAAALDWWRLAGVEHDYADAPRGWLKDPAPAAAPPETRSAPAPQPAAAPPPAAAPVVMLGGPPAEWPADLAAFRAWWLAEPSLDGGRVAGRVPSRGEAGAELLVLVPQPEEEDEAAGQLLAGVQGRLVAAFARAAGLGESRLAVAALLPRHTPFADWDGLASAGLGALARHHIGLIAPQRVLALGGNVLSLLGHDPAQSPAHLALSGPEGRQLALLAGPDPAALLARPAARARLWRDWLDWTA